MRDGGHNKPDASTETPGSSLDVATYAFKRAAVARFGVWPKRLRSDLYERLSDAAGAMHKASKHVRRHYINHSPWSLVLLMTTSKMFASRVLGIVATLLVTIMTLIYLIGRERRPAPTVHSTGPS